MNYEEQERLFREKLKSYDSTFRSITSACQGFIEGTAPLEDVVNPLVGCYVDAAGINPGSDVFWEYACRFYIYGNDKLDSAVKATLTSSKLGYAIYASLRDKSYYIYRSSRKQRR